MRLHALNVVAWGALFFLRPRDARHVVGEFARRLPRPAPEAARDAVQRLKPIGTCLSRSLAIASVLPDAEVIIAVRRDGGPGDVRAHAWVEWEGEPLDPSEVLGEELARL
jgi:hypothetical protein